MYSKKGAKERGIGEKREGHIHRQALANGRGV